MKPIAAALLGCVCLCYWGQSAEFAWRESGAGLAMIRFTNSVPVIFTAIRVERTRFSIDLSLTTTLASNTVVGTEPLASQVKRISKSAGTPVAAMNGDFFMMSGAAKGDPRGLHIWNGELVSTPNGPTAFWMDETNELHAGPVSSRLTIVWPNGDMALAGLNEELGTNAMVLFTPRMGTLYKTTNSPSSAPRRSSPIPKGGPIRLPGGREWLLDPVEANAWLPLRVGHTYSAAVATASFDGFTNVPPGKMILSVGSNSLASLPELTNHARIVIHVATAPDLRGIQTGIGTGPLLVHEKRVYEVTARMSEQPHPRAALGWNQSHLYFAVVDGRQKGISAGLRLDEMAEFMIALGCDEAIDMDGGQSTTLMLNGTVVNQPTSGRHDVANGIVILRRGRLEEAEPED